jgi:hypothetical protein
MKKITLTQSNSYCKFSNTVLNTSKTIGILSICLFFNLGLVYGQFDVADNGGFETGDFTGWEQTLVNGTQTVGAFDPTEGAFAANLNNDVEATASLIKNANKGIGVVSPGDNITVTFDARGSAEAGGVAFAELFSELSGGGTSASVILGGGPLALNIDPDVWTSFTFSTVAGSDVSGGLTLQLNATTGGNTGSFSNIFFDNVKIIDEDVLSVDENSFNAQNLKLYPNPALNTITLNNAESIALQQVSLYDLSGRLLQTVAASAIGSETTIDVSSLVASTYLVVIQTETGEITKQFIKQ